MCSGLQNASEYRRINDWVCSLCSFPPTLPKPQPLPSSIPTQVVDGNSFTNMQFTLIHKSINFSRKFESSETVVEPHLEELTITATLQDTELIITNVIFTPSKLLRRRLPSFPGPSDDDDGYPNTGILQCTLLGVVLKLDRYERHPIGEYDIWLHLQLADEYEPRLIPSTNSH